MTITFFNDLAASDLKELPPYINTYDRYLSFKQKSLSILSVLHEDIAIQTGLCMELSETVSTLYGVYMERALLFRDDRELAIDLVDHVFDTLAIDVADNNAVKPWGRVGNDLAFNNWSMGYAKDYEKTDACYTYYASRFMDMSKECKHKAEAYSRLSIEHTERPWITKQLLAYHFKKLLTEASSGITNHERQYKK